MALKRLTIKTHGEKLYPITDQIKNEIVALVKKRSGVLHLFCPHTSCGLTLNESYDPSAKEDLESFLMHVVPRNLSFIKHTDEGEDDSPSHMKTLLTGSSLQLIIEQGEVLLGTWQGIYLCEFRDQPKTRTLYLKFLEG